MPTPADLQDFLLTPAELCARWGLAEAPLRTYRSQGKEPIPHVRLPGGSIRYRASDVIRCELDGYQGATYDDIEAAAKSVQGMTPALVRALVDALKARAAA